jgi:transposase-like protein
MSNTYYSTEFKKMATELIIISKQSTIKTAKDLNVPLKTLEKWITAYNKNNKIFDSDYISPEQQIQSLKKRIAELETTNDILKKTLGFYIKKNQ